MKVLVFGATGATGRLVVQQALSKGHKVTAFVRNAGKIDFKNSNLKLAQGNVLQQSSIDAIMPDHEAVICCIGAPAGKAAQLRSEGTRNILNSMKKNGVSRFICQASMGYADSENILKNTPFFFRKIIVPFLLKKTFEDHALQETYIQETDLNWTILRPGSLTNGKYTGNYRHGFEFTDRSVKVKISRADVADFILKQLQAGECAEKIIGLSY
ncbi:MAG: SDR family oxidoreductase [Ferruginibacter sp.]